MTDTEINIAIAECCGWTGICVNSWGDYVGHEHDKLLKAIPRYCTDLNAMAQAIKSFGKTSEWMSFIDHLRSIVCADFDEDPNTDAATVWCMINSTARQRAEAFLRMKGLWKS